MTNMLQAVCSHHGVREAASRAGNPEAASLVAKIAGLRIGEV
jgi:hypothetical protein